MNGSMFIGTWWALVPPLLAILLAFVTKEVYSSLFIGSAVGVLLYTGFHPWDAFTSFFEILRNSMNINIFDLRYPAWHGCRADGEIRRLGGVWKMGGDEDQNEAECASGNDGAWCSDFCG